MQAIKKQSDDIHLLLERMEEQIRTMLKTYRHNFLQIEVASSYGGGRAQKENLQPLVSAYLCQKELRLIALTGLTTVQSSMADVLVNEAEIQPNKTTEWC